MKITGLFVKASEVKTFDSGFQVREFFLDAKTFNQFTGAEYPNVLKFQCTGSRMDNLQGLSKGDRITVDFEPKGRTYPKEDGSIHQFQQLNAWNIEVIKKAEGQTAPSDYDGLTF